MCKAWYTTYPDYLCVLGYRADITSTQFHPLCYARLGLVGRDYSVCPEGRTGFKTANRIFREVSCVHLLPPGLLELWHFTYLSDRSAAHSPPIACAWPGGTNAP